MRVLITLVMTLASSWAFAQSQCPFDPTPLWSGQVYAFDGNLPTAVWNGQLPQVPQRRTMDLYYVIKTNGADRSGVVVVKSARFGLPADDDNPIGNRVQLKRMQAQGACGWKKPFVGTVTTNAYSEYHDYGKENGANLRKMEGDMTARRAIERFHTNYEAVKGVCRSTNAKTLPDGTYFARSNRSQFSFYTNIVDDGFNSPAYNVASATINTIWSFVFPTAFAEGQKLRERAVEIIRYKTKNGVACVPFKINVRDSAQVLRVNDLERERIYAVSTEYRFGSTVGADP